MILHINDTVDSLLWEELIKVSNYSSPFQTPALFHFFNSTEYFSADVFAAEESNIYTTLVVVTVQKERGIKGYFSRRGVIYGGPLLRESSISLPFVLDSINKFYDKKLIYIESRNLFDYSHFTPVFRSKGWNHIPYLNVVIQVNSKSLEEIIAQFKYNRRREIKQSIAEGASWAEIESEAGILGVYKILNELYQTRVKLPLPPPEFFVGFWNSGIMKAFAVYHNESIIGGAFCPFLPQKAIYTMYYCGKRNYHPRIYPTHLAVVAAFEYGIKTGCQYLDFMGAGKPESEYGVRKYKSEFGGELTEPGRYIKVYSSRLYRLGKFALYLLKKIS